MREVFVGGPDANLFYPRVPGREVCGGGEGIVGFELDHRPHSHAHRCQSFFERMKLCAQNALDAGAGFVARPQAVSKGFDYMIGRDTDMSRAVFDHLRDRVEHAGDSAERRIRFLEAPNAVEVTKEFVGAVDEVNDH